MKKLLIILLFLPLVSWGQYITADSYSATVSENYLQIPDNDLLTFSYGGQDKPFFISIWANLNERNSSLFAKPQEYQIRILSTGTVLVDFFDTLQGGVIGRQTSGTAMSGKWNKWTHFVLSYDGSESPSGVDIYLDGVEVDITDRFSGTYTNMGARTFDLNIGRLSPLDGTFYCDGGLLDFRVGGRDLTQNAVDSLYLHQYLGDELIIIPMTDGTGTYATNVANDNINFAAKSIDDVGEILWSNTQTEWEYNNEIGFTQVIADNNTWIFPYLIDSTPSFSDLNGYLLWGQSNAGGLANANDLDDTQYEDARNQINEFSIYNYVDDRIEIMYNGNNGFSTTDFLGVDPLIALRYKNDSKNSFVMKYAIGSTVLDSIPVSLDWSPKSQELYRQAVDTSVRGLLNLFEMGKNPYINSFAWIQGESDAQLIESAPRYQENLNLLYDSVSNVFQDDINMQLIMLGDQYSGAYTDTIIKYQKLFKAEKGSLVDTISTNNATYVSCCTHYDSDTYIWMADTIYNRRNEIQLESSKSFLYKYFEDVSIVNSTDEIPPVLLKSGEKLIKYKNRLIIF